VAHTTTFHKQNALAHYRVLKQHTHTPPEPLAAPVKAACTTLHVGLNQVNSLDFSDSVAAVTAWLNHSHAG
ncbi:hypothetical protein QP446_05105, partial [Corynebacterium riegelii]|uniref:hypothetical protein n=1 Tax=Corynebacterium riegelii TaxID=156976 RepID=UPI00254C29D8